MHFKQWTSQKCKVFQLDICYRWCICEHDDPGQSYGTVNVCETSLCSAAYISCQQGIHPPHATTAAIDQYLLPARPAAAGVLL